MPIANSKVVAVTPAYSTVDHTVAFADANVSLPLKLISPASEMPTNAVTPMITIKLNARAANMLIDCQRLPTNFLQIDCFFSLANEL